MNKFNRCSVRIKGFDYSAPGEYFVTICVHRYEWLLGEITKDEFLLLAIGEIVDQCWEEILNCFLNIE